MNHIAQRLSQHRESGLKYDFPLRFNFASLSLPTQGEWIEITETSDLNNVIIVSPNTGRVD